MTSVVRSGSRDGLLRPTLVCDVTCHCGNHYVIDRCQQQVSNPSPPVSSCPHGGTVPVSACRRRVPISTTCSDNLNTLCDCCGRLSPEMTDSRNSPVKPFLRYGDVRLDDEHRLIARYVERLSTMECACLNGKQPQYDARQQIVAELEAKNRAIMQEIHRIRQEQQLQLQQQQHMMMLGPGRCLLDHASYQLVSGSDSHLAPRRSGVQVVPCLRYSLVDELCHLRRRRDELECRMVALQSSRHELVSQLEDLMNVLKSRSTTPSTSPRSPLPVIDVGGPALSAVSGDVQQAFASYRQMSPPGSPQLSYRPLGMSRDLLEATDFITDAVTSLVRELNSDDSADSSDEMLNAQKHDGTAAQWPPGVDFLAELRQHRLFRSPDDKRLPHSSDCSSSAPRIDGSDYNSKLTLAPPTTTNRLSVGDVSDSCAETDQESYIRTDDEEQGSTDWEEARIRWINR